MSDYSEDDDFQESNNEVSQDQPPKLPKEALNDSSDSNLAIQVNAGADDVFKLTEFPLPEQNGESTPKQMVNDLNNIRIAETSSPFDLNKQSLDDNHIDLQHNINDLSSIASDHHHTKKKGSKTTRARIQFGAKRSPATVKGVSFVNRNKENAKIAAPPVK